MSAKSSAVLLSTAVTSDGVSDADIVTPLVPGASSAAKLVRRFPALMEAIAAGELHLTGLLMLGPQLTDENHVEVLACAKFRTKKEIGKLIRRLAPLPQVPDNIEPLRPALPKAPRNPTWAEFVESLCPPVRELRPGERPSDWANETLEKLQPPEAAPARVDEPPPLTEPLLYLMQFTATEEHVQLIERAKALLARQAPGRSLGDLHLQAMRLLVEALEKRRFGAKARPRKEPASPQGTRTCWRIWRCVARRTTRWQPSKTSGETTSRQSATAAGTNPTAVRASHPERKWGQLRRPTWGSVS